MQNQPRQKYNHDLHPVSAYPGSLHRGLFSDLSWAPRIDTGGAILDRISQTFTEEYRADLLGGVAVTHGKGYAIDEAGWQDELYREEAPTVSELEITSFLPCLG